MLAKIAALTAFVALVTAVTPPVWPDQYTLSGTFTIPTYPATITEPLVVYSDYANQQQRIDYYNSANVMISKLAAPGNFYQINPRISQQYCWVYTGADYQGSMINVLPNVSSWTYMGKQNGPYCPAGNCTVWQDQVTVLSFTSTYTLFVNDDGTPQSVVLAGYDQMFGSHPDLYILSIDEYTPSIDSTVFDEPSLCAANAPTRIEDPSHRQGFWAKLKMGQLGVFNAPAVNPSADPAWEEFKIRYRKFYFSNEEHDRRRGHFADISATIARHNADHTKTFKLGMNHLGDLTAAERKYLLHPSPVTGDQSDALFEITAGSAGSLPSSLDWVLKGAVNPPSDQGVCGSCWTFGTCGSLEGAWAVKYGKLPQLAEQQIVDCDWDPNPNNALGNQGCNGGFASGALQWIQDNGGIATDATYPYLMADGYCYASLTDSGVTVKGYLNVTSGSEAALQAATATYGPIAIAIDAAHVEFEFYQSGVYYNPACNSSLAALDHEVLVAGYGTFQGADYWLVRNSWSNRWGDKGFIMMSRNRNNNCGIATQATAPFV